MIQQLKQWPALKYICLIYFFGVLGCVHTKTIEVTQPSLCEGKDYPLGKMSPTDKKGMNYVQNAKRVTDPVFKSALIQGLKELRRHDTILKVENPKRNIATRMSVVVDSTGEVKKWETICPFGVPEFDDAIADAQKSMVRFDQPEKELLDSQGEFKFKLDLVLEE